MNYGNAGVAKNTVEPAREAQVSGELGRLENALNDVEKSFAVMSDRIQPIVRSDVPSAEKDGPRPVETLVPVADRIRKSKDRLVALSALITNYYSRIEL